MSLFENFFKLKRGDLISWGEPILHVGWIIWSPLLYFNIKHLKNPNSSSFIRFQCILHDSALLLSVLKNVLKLRKGNLISWEEPIVENDWIIWSPFLYFNIKHLKDQTFSAFITFQCILYNSSVPLWVFESFSKLKRRNLFWGEINFRGQVSYLVPPAVFQYQTFEEPNFFVIH